MYLYTIYYMYINKRLEESFGEQPAKDMIKGGLVA